MNSDPQLARMVETFIGMRPYDRAIVVDMLGEAHADKLAPLLPALSCPTPSPQLGSLIDRLANSDPPFGMTDRAARSLRDASALASLDEELADSIVDGRRRSAMDRVFGSLFGGR